jgi:hypothetical protein
MTERQGMRRRGEGAQPARRLAGLGRLDAEAIASLGEGLSGLAHAASGK